MAEKRVFICYRDQDAPFAPGRIAEFLKSSRPVESMLGFRRRE